MNFKTNTRITLLAGVISGLVAIVMAYKGFGIWSIASQLVLQSFLRTVFLWFFVRWKPKMQFSVIHIRKMSAYSIKLLLTTLLNQICGNIVPLIIGKKFDFMQVAAYNQAGKLNNIPQSIISDGVKSVAYPLLTKIDEDEEREKRIFRKVVRITAFISFPVAMMLIVTAKPIVGIYLPPEWADVTPFLQVLAVGGAFFPLYSLISSLLQYKGKSGLLLKIELFRNILLLCSIAIGVQYGVLGLVTCISAVSAISFFFGMYISGRTISYTIKEILFDISPYLGIAIVSFLPMLLLYRTEINNIYLQLLIPFFAGSCVYLFIVKVLGSVIIKETIDFIKQSLK